jgi:predicted component of type VI protein secretion system
MSLQTAAVGRTAAIQESGLLDQIIAESRVAQSDHEKNRARDIISELVNQVLEGEVVVSENLAASLDARVAELDRLISEQLSEVMHAPEFQALERMDRLALPVQADIHRNPAKNQTVQCFETRSGQGLQVGHRL